MVLPCVDFDVNLFVDRDAEKIKLEQIVSFSVDQKGEEKPRDYQRVAHLIGKSRVGKSYLLCNYNKYLEDKDVHRVGLSFANINVSKDDLFIVQVLNTLYDQITPYIVGQLRDRSGMAVNDLSDLFVEEIKHIEKKGIVAFLFDEVSMLSDDRIRLLEDYLLARVLLLPNVVVVLAGRYLKKGWKEFALRPIEDINIIELLNFDYENTQKQIRAMNPHIDELVPEIHDVSSGSPGNNRKIVEQLGDPLQFNKLNAIRICNNEYHDGLNIVKNSLEDNLANQLEPILEALCVLQDFDKEYEMPVMLSAHPALIGNWTVQYCAYVLNILSKVQVGPGKLVDWDMEKSALAIEEQTRFNLEKELMMRDVDLWKTLHRTAMKMYDEWANEHGADSIFADKAEYHKTKFIKAGIDPETCG
jgi:hypothetical protein